MAHELERLLSMYSVLGSVPRTAQTGVMVQAYTPSTQEVEVGESGVQSNPYLQSKLETWAT